MHRYLVQAACIGFVCLLVLGPLPMEEAPPASGTAPPTAKSVARAPSARGARPETLGQPRRPEDAQRSGSDDGPLGRPSLAQGPLTPMADACVQEAYPDENAGDTVDMLAGYDDSPDANAQRMRALLRFDLPAIPAGSVVRSATLRLYISRSRDYPGRVRQVSAHRADGAWSESLVTWRNAPEPAESYGSALIAHMAWGWCALDVTALVQQWLDGAQPNEGLMILGPEQAGADSAWRGFSSREGPYPPELVVEAGATTLTPTAPPTATPTPDWTATPPPTLCTPTPQVTCEPRDQTAALPLLLAGGGGTKTTPVGTVVGFKEH